ncbi:MAG: hemoblobin-interacting domain-containing protein [Verrucomicrobiota bacterium]|jgi:hypothetical protein
MKKTFGLLGLATMLCVTAQAQTTLTAWTFDNLPIGINSSPSPSAGLGAASALGMNNSYNNTNSLSNPDVQSLAGSSSGGPNSWRIRGFSTIAGSRGNGWSTSAPVGTQGAQFSGSTFGYYKIKISFDVYATSDAEAGLQVQYTTDGSTWNNATVTSVGSRAVIQNNAVSSATTNATVFGSYVTLASGWNNQITVNLAGISGVDNNTNFAVRLVNASSGTNCVNTTGAVYNNTSGNWTFDNVVIQGQTIDVIADWSFDLIGTQAAPDNSPAPTTGSGVAIVLGMTNTYTFASGPSYSYAWADVTATGSPYPSTGNDSYGWRVRGGTTGAGVPNSGWNTAAPIGTQGAEFNVDTTRYSNVVCSFNLYFTTQAEAKMCVFYTTNGWASSNVANTLFYGGNPGFVVTNNSSANTVIGTYFWQTNGQGFYDSIVVDFTGVPGVQNNPLFGFSVVNAATSGDCVNYLGTSYNNLSGNWRYDNVTVGGTSGTPPPTITADPNATVDNPFTNTFTDNPAWRANISAVYVNGVILTNSAYNTNIAGEIIFNPAKSVLLQSSGLLNLAVISHGFGTARVLQPLGAGVATQLAIPTQAAGPSASGGTLTANPVLLVADQYGNGTTNPYANVSVTASVGGSGGWTLGGDTTQAAVDGLIAFTNLSATVNGSSAVSNAFITFTVSGYPPVTVTNSAAFNIGVPPVPFTPGNLAVLQIDTLNNNTTFSIIEVNPSQAGQTSPVNIVPISATGTNALRESSSGSTGRLALSDDGTLLGFAAFVDGSAATPDETLNLNRAAASLNWSNQVTVAVDYTSISLGGSQARAACVLDDDLTWIVDDKGGLYEGSLGDGTVTTPNLNPYNNVVVRTFGGTPFVETQKANSQSLPVVYALSLDAGSGLYDTATANNLPTDGNASDFYLISTNGGTTYDVLYVADQNSSTNGVIRKYSLTGGTWTENGSLTANGSFTNSTGIDGLFATTNGNGGVYLFYTTGSGGTGSNSIVRVTDAAGWDQNISIISSNVIYTTSKGTSLKGLTFVPQQATNAVELIPPPILTAQNGALAGFQFSVTTSPEVPAWRSAIASITVNGSTLPPAAYDTTQSGKIVFKPAQSALLQSPGLKTIVIGAAGYSGDTVVQALGVYQSLLNGVSLSGDNLTFAFTNATGLGFSVLATNNLAAPVSTWPVVGTAVENPSGSGHYQFTTPYPATNSAQFYILRQP